MPNSQGSNKTEGSFGTKRRRHQVVSGGERVQWFSLGSKVAALRSVGSQAVLAMGAEPTVRRALDLGIGKGRSYKATLTIQDGVQLKGGKHAKSCGDSSAQIIYYARRLRGLSLVVKCYGLKLGRITSQHRSQCL